MISISHHGATSGVTGSCHELTLAQGGQKSGILIDCGLFQGQDEGRGASASDLSIFPSSISGPCWLPTCISTM
jgi:metallo-beta-lactamase family protein